MKKLIYIKLLLLSMLLMIGCVEDDFGIPDLTVVEPTINGQIVTIDAIRGVLAQAQNNGDATFSFQDTNQYISGYVISSDEAGNFFEEIVIQDALENPTIGIKLLIDLNPLFTRYEIGRRVFVKLDGLTIGIDNGVFAIGTEEGNGVGQIPASLEEVFIQRSAEVGELVPLPIDLDNLTDDMTNLYVTIADAQFNRFEVLIPNPLTFASEPLDEFDGERTLESCNSNSTIIFSTSTFADFKSLELPSGRGAIQGILTRDFFGEVFNFVINTPEEIDFDASTERCDPVELNCDLAATQGTINIFEDDFETQIPGSLITGNGWTNFIQEGTQGFEAFTSTGTNASLGVSVNIGSFSSGDASSIAWLITPEINLDTQDGETLRFMTSNSFSDGSELELLFSPDWDGTEANIANATWGVVSAAFIVQDDDFFGDWFDSEIVDLSCGTGTIHVAFRYTGSGNAAFDGTFEIDEFTIDYQ